MFENWSTLKKLIWLKATALAGGVRFRIVYQPPGLIERNDGELFNISVVATGEGLSYQWAYQRPGTTNWTNMSSAAGKLASWEGTMAPTYNGRKYRCVITDTYGETLTSESCLIRYPVSE